MFRPNNYGMLSKQVGRNIYGEFRYKNPVKVPCAIVDNVAKQQRTPVRTDSSADRGASEEKVAQVKILFLPNVVITSSDKFEIAGLSLRVVAIQQRYSVLGVLDHLEVDFDIDP